jgi:hypothetical protein
VVVFCEHGKEPLGGDQILLAKSENELHAHCIF